MLVINRYCSLAALSRTGKMGEGSPEGRGKNCSVMERGASLSPRAHLFLAASSRRGISAVSVVGVGVPATECLSIQERIC